MDYGFYINLAPEHILAILTIQTTGKIVSPEYTGTLIIIDNAWITEETKEIYYTRKQKKLKTKIICDHSLEEMNEDFQKLFVEHLSSIDPEDVLVVYWYSIDLQGKSLVSPFKSVPVDGCGLYTHYTCLVEKTQPINTTLVKDRDNRLNVLIAKLRSRDVRFIMTYYLYKHDLLRNSVLGIIAEPNDFKGMMEKHPKYADENFYKEIINYLGPADDIPVVDLGEDGLGLLLVFTFDPDIFRKSSLSLISETFDVYQLGHGPVCTHPFLLTEKFYRAIVNKHPFIIQGTAGMLDTIKMFGYQTFSDIIDESYNYYTTCDFSHVEPTVLAAKDFLTKIPQNAEKIQEIVDHNFNNFKERMDEEREKIRQVIENFCNS